MDHPFQVRKPDLVLINKKKRTYPFVNFAVSVYKKGSPNSGQTSRPCDKQKETNESASGLGRSSY